MSVSYLDLDLISLHLKEHDVGFVFCYQDELRAPRIPHKQYETLSIE